MSGDSFQLLTRVKAGWLVALWLCISLFLAVVSHASTVSLTWNAGDGNVSGYRVYYGQSSGNYTTTAPSTSSFISSTQYITPDLPAGTYYFAVKSFDSAGNESPFSNERSATVTAPLQPPMASFSYTLNPTSGQAPVLSTFTDTSPGTVTTRSWKFSDSATTYTTQTVGRDFTVAGTYTAELTVSNASGSSKATKTITVLPTAPAAEFTSDVTTGSSPLTVHFSDNSTPTGGISGWSWNFGDSTSGSNNTSTQQNPTHVFAASGTYTITLVASNSSGSATKIKTGYITVTSTPQTKDDLVAAYNFDALTGSVVADASGNGNHGAVSGTVQTSSGKYGKALSFDGVDDWVTINNSDALALTNGMSLEAWVYPTATMNSWEAIITKEQPDGFGAAYYLAANSDNGQPEMALFTNGWHKLYGTSTVDAQKWTHLAGTYDGTAMKLYVNGTMVSQQAQTGPIDVTDGVLHIGGNAGWGEFFKGYIDEIRIYKRALSISEIQADMSTPIADSSSPTLLIGENTLGSASDSISSGVPIAFQSTARLDGIVTQLMIYVDAGSSCTNLVAGIYSERNGVPYRLISKGTLSSPTAGNWNTVILPAASIVENRAYWIAILSTNGKLKFRDRVGNSAQPSVKSFSFRQSTLPTSWKTGSTSYMGPVSAYGTGY